MEHEGDATDRALLSAMSRAQEESPIASPVAQHGYEPRNAPRFARDSRAQLLIHPAGRHSHPIDVTVTDYSKTGIGVLHSEGLLMGQTFIVREPFVTHNGTCIYTVVRSERRPDGMFSIGLHVQNTFADELEQYASPPPPPLSRRAKQWYLTYAIIGGLTIVSLAVLKNAPATTAATPNGAVQATTAPSSTIQPSAQR